jgi:hypothetical protein
MLTAVQFVRPFFVSADNTGAISSPSGCLRTHAREEVGGKAFDLSSEGCRGLRLPVGEFQQHLRMPEFAAEAEIDIAPTRHLIHRRVAPAAADDSFPPLVQ